MQVTLEQVRDIINANDGNQNVHIESLSEIKNVGFSYTASRKSYYIALSDSDRSYLLLVSPPAPNDPQPGNATPLGPITLPALSILLSKILDNTAVPVPRPVAHDVSGGEGRWHFGWLLLRVPSSSQTHPPTSLTTIRHRLSPKQLARVELRLGTYLRALHGVTNDWFGIPTDKPTPGPPSIPSFDTLFATGQISEDAAGDGEDMAPYSWQDTFVLHLEELLDQVCGDAAAGKTVPSGHMVDVDINQLRRALFRAIGSFLFDDVVMPGLVWVTGNDEDVVVSLIPKKDTRQDDESTAVEEDIADIAYILPTFGHAIWGDPLMEAWFLPPGPTKAINEGYFGDEKDGTLILFPRHKTKRTWYTVYLALLILAEEMSQGEGERMASDRKVVRWARSILSECVEILKDAPCY